MTRKDFEAIAASFNAVQANGKGQRENLVTWTAHDVADRIADHMATTNPRFDRQRFMLACGFAS